MEFDGKTVIVTGAAVGIGLSTAKEFALRGANTILVDYDRENLKKAVDIISKTTSLVSSYVCDVSDEASVHNIVNEVISKYGKVDILVNNAGIWRCGWAEFVNQSSDDWKKKINVNLLGMMYFTQSVLPIMYENNYGRIINLGSVAGVYGNRRMVDYSMTKGAVIAFTTALAKEAAEYNVTVNTVSPGNIKTEKEEKDNLDLSFIKRSGTTQECADLICFLAGDKAGFISGQNYLIDGSRKAM